MDDGEDSVCHLCGKRLSRKQRLYTHLRSKHNVEADVPSKRYKLYKDDPNVPVPRTTLYRQRISQAETENEDSHENATASASVFSMRESSQKTITNDNNSTCSTQDNSHRNVSSENEEPMETMDDMNAEISTSTSCSLQDNLSEIVEFSDTDSGSSRTDDSYTTTSESDSSDDETINATGEITNNPVLSHCEEKHMTFLAYANRHCLNREAVNHLMELFSIHNPGESEQAATTLKMKSTVGEINAELYDFCAKCFSLFPDDDSIFHCVLPTCTGLRYKGTVTQQGLKQRKSFFACTKTEHQIKNILERKGMWNTLINYKRTCLQGNNIKDILNGEMYADLRRPGNFLSSENNISLLFNTDGVPLYNSSKVGLWPVYLVINELPPVIRFSRQNMILWGVWQSKSKPAFQTYFRPFVQEMIKLKTQGFSLSVGNKIMNTKAILLAGTLDLQAKAMILEMTHHNGEFACITCEEPGIVVPQGKGHARVFPFRIDPATTRTSNGVLDCAVEALQLEGRKPHVKGIRNVSVLHGMEWFDTVNGMVPDYMHGVLLGLTKQMLSLMISSSNSTQPYFVGHSIKDIDKYLTSMNPMDTVPRLPRKLEEHLHNFKASELQMWLLYYALPCLINSHKAEYLHHLALLIEGIYILLRDDISVPQLDRAQDLLKTFYNQFSDLYGANNMTLNLHNVGQHLSDYVRKLGPLWAWSCFPFEDMNGSLLEQVHGTGNVCLQILWTLQAQKRLAVDSEFISNPSMKSFVQKMLQVGRQVKIKKETRNCKIAGGMEVYNADDITKEKLKELLSVQELGTIFKALRIIKNDQIYFSAQYKRMEKRVSHIVSVHSHPEMSMASIQFFLYHEDSDSCVAVVKKIVENEARNLIHPVVSHIINIDPNFDASASAFVTVDKLERKLLFLTGNPDFPCVSRLPNLYGQCS